MKQHILPISCQILLSFNSKVDSAGDLQSLKQILESSPEPPSLNLSPLLRTGSLGAAEGKQGFNSTNLQAQQKQPGPDLVPTKGPKPLEQVRHGIYRIRV